MTGRQGVRFMTRFLRNCLVGAALMVIGCSEPTQTEDPGWACGSAIDSRCAGVAPIHAW